jgi:hypothetical protein
MKKMRPAGIFLLLTVLFGGLPFVVYVWQRYSGSLPGPEEWLARGINHGPWRWQAEGFAVAYPMVILAAVTLAVFAVLAARRRSFSALWQGLVLIGVQAAVLYGQVATLHWTID